MSPLAGNNLHSQNIHIASIQAEWQQSWPVNPSHVSLDSGLFVWTGPGSLKSSVIVTCECEGIV